MSRSKLELPETLIQKIKALAQTNRVSPSILIQKAIEQADNIPQIPQKGTINITLQDNHIKKLKSMANQLTIKRGSKLYPATKTAIIEAILTNFTKKEQENNER